MRRASILLSFALILFAGVVLPAHAANLPLLDPNFTIVPKGCLSCPCSYAAVLQFIQNIMNAMISLGVIAFVLVLAYAGFSFMMNPTNPEARSRARSMLINVVVGMVIVLAAWLLVDFIMKTLYNPGTTTTSGVKFGPWNEILNTDTTDPCIEPTAFNPVSGPTGSTGVGSVVGGSNQSPSSVGGKCAVQTSGRCSQTNFTSPFGAASGQASQICSAESCNGGCLQGDKIPGTSNYVSFGIFQINITAHQVAGLNCPRAFDSTYTGSHKNVQIIDQRLYQECKSAALIDANNTAVAYGIYSKDGNSWREWSTHTQCQLALGERTLFAAAACTIYNVI